MPHQPSGKSGLPYLYRECGAVGITGAIHGSTGSKYGIRANAILPSAVDEPRIQRVFEGRAKVSGKTMEQIKKETMSVQSHNRLANPKDIAALAVFLASDAAKSISGQMMPIDNDMQQAG